MFVRIATLQPAILAIVVVVYFGLLIAATFLAIFMFPGLEDYLPLAGQDARDVIVTGDRDSDIIVESALRDARSVSVYAVAITLFGYLVFSILIMIPVTWVYVATHEISGLKRNFVISLLAFPILSTSMVLLIQDSLALAFGLAALVGALRFRISLKDTLDGIYVLAAIAVGLATGVGFVGVGVVTTLVFCLVMIALWKAPPAFAPATKESVGSENTNLAVQQTGDPDARGSL